MPTYICRYSLQIWALSSAFVLQVCLKSPIHASIRSLNLLLLKFRFYPLHVSLFSTINLRVYPPVCPLTSLSFGYILRFYPLFYLPPQRTLSSGPCHIYPVSKCAYCVCKMDVKEKQILKIPLKVLDDNKTPVASLHLRGAKQVLPCLDNVILHDGVEFPTINICSVLPDKK